MLSLFNQKGQICRVQILNMHVCACSTHCKMQGTGINFLHFAETFGLGMTLACRPHCKDKIYGTVRLWCCHFYGDSENSPRRFHITDILHISSAARPLQRNRSFQQCNDQLPILLMPAQVLRPWKLTSPVVLSHLQRLLSELLRMLSHIIKGLCQGQSLCRLHRAESIRRLSLLLLYWGGRRSQKQALIRLL